MFKKIADLFKHREATPPDLGWDPKNVEIVLAGPLESDNGVHRRIAVVCDRSGSMSLIKSQTENGLTEFLVEQRAQYPNTRVTLVDFNTSAVTRYLDRKITEVPAYRMDPLGGTHLWSAVHHGVAEMEKSIAFIPVTEKSEKIVVILTDGEDTTYGRGAHTLETVRALITEKRAQGWIFIFLGADEDAVTTGTSMGISADTSLAYNLSKAGSTFTTASAMVSRGSVSGDYSATSGERINLRKD